jgi:hypothetical protein
MVSVNEVNEDVDVIMNNVDKEGKARKKGSSM